MSVMLYGVGSGNGSWARVTAGVRRGLEACGKLAGFYDVAMVDNDYDLYGHAMTEGYDAPVGLCVGSPRSATVMVGRGDHHHKMLMIAANSSWLPGVIMERAAKVCTEFVAPSSWSSSVVERYASGRQVLVYAHGVDPGFRPLTEEPSGSFRVLHLASTHMERKGTRELIEGWVIADKRGDLPRGARLRLVIDGPRGLFNHTIFEATGGDPDLADTIELSQRLNLKVHDMAALYQDHHLIAQPSRAEGFGMVPLEARACGVPVIMTTCTGHADHAGTLGVVRVEVGRDGPVDDGPGAVAPTVTPEAIADALAFSAGEIDSLTSQAIEASHVIRDRWSWEAVTADFLAKNDSIFESK